jgi:hypothetical protein
MNFEQLTIKALLVNKNELIPDLREDLFTNANKRLYKLIIGYFSDHHKLPSTSELIAIIDSKAPEHVKAQFKALVKAIDQLDLVEDIGMLIKELKDALTVRLVDDQITQLIEAQREKESATVKSLLNQLNEKVNLSNVVITDLQDMQNAKEDHVICRSFLTEESEKQFLGGGHTGLTVYSAVSGGGKAQPLSEPVLTPNGWKTMGGIKPNDYVIGSDGLAKRVINTYPQGKRPIYKVQFIDGTFTYCDLDHLWTVKVRGKKKLETISTKDMLDSIKGTPRLDKRYGTYHECYNYAIPINHCGVHDFTSDITDNDINPYLLGLLLGDGSFTTSVLQFTNGSLDLVNKMITLLPKGNVVNTCVYDKGAYRANIVAKENIHPLKDKLKEYGLWGHLSVEKFIPKKYLTASYEVRKALYQALIATDGYVLSNGKVKEFSTSSPRLAKDFLELARSLGYIYSISERIPTYTYKGEKRFGQKSYRLRQLNKNYKSIADISYSHIEEAQCIYIDSFDHLYVTRGYNLTHNTIALLQCAINNYMSGKNVMMVSLELGKKVVYNRALSNVAEVDFTKINNSTTDDEEKKKIKEAHDLLFAKDNKNTFKIIDDTVDDSQLVNIIVTSHQVHKIDVFVIDYLQLVESSGYGDDWKMLSKLCKKLHKLTKELPITIVAASQVNVEKKAKGAVMPEISSRGSKEVIFSSSQFLFFNRDEETGGLIMFQIKNRLAQPQHLVLDPKFKYMKMESFDTVIE